MLTHARISGVCESWSLEDLVGMTEQDMDGLLSHYQTGDIPPLLEVRMKNL
jgi:precorrin-2 dehydrogenase/sirohydrochlorin ferrochelatase